jgi:phosphonate transport system substrate-binding protein
MKTRYWNMAVLGFTLLAVAGGLLASAEALAQAADWRKQYPKFRYGVQAVETQAAAMSRYKAFGDYIKKKFGIELELFLSAEYAGVIQAIGAKQLEVMDMGAAGYAAAWLETKGGVEPLVVPTNNDGTIGY